MRYERSLGFFLLFALTACRGPGEASPTAASPELPAEVPVAAERIVESPGKPTPPIGIRYELLGRPQVGQPLSIRITTRSSAVANAVATQVQGDEGLHVSEASANFAVATMSVDEPVVNTLSVTPLREGIHYLSVVVQGEIDGVVQADTVRIPIRIGDAQPVRKPVGTPATDETGEAIISLPADQN